MDKIFLEIFNTSLTAGGIVLAVLVLRLLLKKAPRAYTCALWGIVGLRLVWPFSIESGLSLIPSPEVIPQSQLYDATPQVQTGIPSLNSAVNPVFSQTFAPEVGASVNPLQVVLSVAGWVWVIGMAAMVIYSLVSYLRLRRQVCAAVRQEGNVYLCDNVASPFILGIFRPKIYLPSDMPQEQIACVLAHERAHLKRKDHWLKPLGFALLMVHWFHPLLWLAYILLCRDIEFACDEKVIADMDAEEKAHYSETLLSCSISRKQVSACPLAFGETGVKGRIQSVLNYKKPAFWMILIALIVCTAVAVGFLTEPVAANQEVSGSPGFYFDIDQDGIEEKIDCIWGGSGIIQFWVGIYEPGERLPKYDSSYHLGAGLRPSLFVAENGKAYVLLKDSDGRIAHWLEIRIEHEELNLYENGERWRNIYVSTFEHYLFNSAYGISMDLYWQKQTQIHAVYDSSRPRYMLGEDKMLYACERNDRGDYIAVRITGVMEQITLTEENFDSLISEDYWLASGIDAVSAREDNVATWQGTNVSGMSYYVMLQANGNVLLCSVGSEMHRIIWLNPVGDADDFYAYIDSMNAD